MSSRGFVQQDHDCHGRDHHHNYYDYHHFDLCDVRLLDDHVHHDHYNHHDHDDHLDLFSLFFSGLLGWVGGASESPCLVRFPPIILIFNFLLSN